MKRYKLQLTLKGPLLFQASGAARLGIDSAAQRYNENPVINGSLIKGNLRHTYHEFADILQNKGVLLKSINYWFGKESTNSNDESGFTPHRGRAQFDLFWHLINPVDAKGVRTRIAINANGVATQGALQTIEDIAPTGCTDPIFEGEIKTDFSSEKEDKIFLLWLDRALSFIPALGSLKGIGYGRLLEYKLEEVAAREHKLPVLNNDTTRINIQIYFDRSICIGKPKTPDSNLIFSSSEIPGATIKGLIAAAYDNDSEALEQDLCFDSLVISHFKPVKIQEQPSEENLEMPAIPRPYSVPLSIATVGSSVIDFSLTDSDTLSLDVIPSFAPDWKPADRKAVYDSLGLSESDPDRHVIVRTGIDLLTETSTEGALFSLECVKPEDHVWQGTIDLSDIESSRVPTVISTLQQCLSKGLHNLGKTHAASKILQWVATGADNIKLIDNDIAVVVLQTDTNLFRSDFENRFANGDTIEDEYAYYWESEDNKNDFKLIRFFAQQKRTGGAYYYWRYQKDESYSPVWLTVAGSVYVVKVLSDQGMTKLHQWVKTGLPVPLLPGKKEQTWEHSPYLPQNGYGEIKVNLAAREKISYQKNSEITT